MASTTEDTKPAPAEGRTLLGRPLPLIGLGLMILLLVVLATAAYAGYQAGLTQRGAQWQATQSAELELQYNLGVQELAAGRYEMAAARFEYILQLNPTYRDAGARLAEARHGLAATATLPPQTTTPTPSPSPTASTAAADLFAEAQAALAGGEWDMVIDRLTRLHGVDPAYEPVRADGMLYVALRNRGVARIQGDAMEAGIFDLDQAEAFGPLDTEAVNLRAWARLYLAAQSYWGVNWQQSMIILQQLYLVAPYFRDTDSRLFRATVNYADQLVAAGDHCAAAELYAEALTVRADAAAAEAEARAREACGDQPDGEDEPEGEGGEAGAEASAVPTPSP
jgi:tetratricopeptide (TPR) repeat protein